MPDQPSSEKKQSLLSSKDIQVPPISKQTAGAVAGAAIGSVVGPIGAVVGGVVGALAGKAASGERPIRKVVGRAGAVSKRALKANPVKKSLPKSRKAGGRSHGKTAKRRESRRSITARSRKRTVRASRKSTRPRQKTTSSRARQKRRSSRKKRH